MSSTLTWHHSGLGTKTGTAIANLIDDFESLFDSKSGDSDFKWEVASKNSASTPYYLVLKRKDGSAGRALVVAWTSLPAGLNPSLFPSGASNPSTVSVYFSFFPNATTDIPSNLTSSSGTIFDDDTGALPVAVRVPVSTIYASNFQPFYFDCEEAIFLGTQDPIGANVYGWGMGYLVVDANDDAYPCVVNCAVTSLSNFGHPSNLAPLEWTDVALDASSLTSGGCIVTHYGAANSLYFRAFRPGAWANHVVDSTDILTDTANSRAWFVPVPLLGQRAGEGFVLKLRQIGWGPGTTAAFQEYATTGPVTAARQFNARTTGGTGYPWFTNFKL